MRNLHVTRGGARGRRQAPPLRGLGAALATAVLVAAGSGCGADGATPATATRPAPPAHAKLATAGWSVLARPGTRADRPPLERYAQLAGQLRPFALDLTRARLLHAPAAAQSAGRPVRGWLVPGRTQACLLVEVPALIQNAPPMLTAHCGSLRDAERGALRTEIVDPADERIRTIVAVVPDTVRQVDVAGPAPRRLTPRGNVVAVAAREPQALRLRTTAGSTAVATVGDRR